MSPFDKNLLVEISWGSGDLLIKNPPPEVIKFLQYYKKTLELDESTFKRTPVQEKVLLWQELESDVIVTFQGFIDDVLRILTVHKIDHALRDCRKPLDQVQIHRARDFRLNQQELFFQFIGQSRSGLLQAPTRYGKTIFIANTIRICPKSRIVVTAPGLDLVKQLHEDLKQWCPDREIVGLYTGSRCRTPSDDVTVVSMDSLEKTNPESVDLLLVDEPHACVAPSRLTAMRKFCNARILGYGATTQGRFDGGDKLITGVIGPVLAKRTFPEAVAEGAICPIVAYVVHVPFRPWSCSRRDTAYRELVFRNDHLNQLIGRLCNQVIPLDWQTLVFISEVKQADLLQEYLGEDGVIAVAKRLGKKERQAVYDAMVSNDTKRCIATSIFSTGVTFPDLRVIVNAAGGGGSITATQKPGRLGQVRPGKKAGYMIDFLFEPLEKKSGANQEWSWVYRDCLARIENYKRIGFDVRFVRGIEEIQLD